MQEKAIPTHEFAKIYHLVYHMQSLWFPTYICKQPKCFSWHDKYFLQICILCLMTWRCFWTQWHLLLFLLNICFYMTCFNASHFHTLIFTIFPVTDLITIIYFNSLAQPNIVWDPVLQEYRKPLPILLILFQMGRAVPLHNYPFREGLIYLCH